MQWSRTSYIISHTDIKSLKKSKEIFTFFQNWLNEWRRVPETQLKFHADVNDKK